jgi:hypothetical protein
VTRIDQAADFGYIQLCAGARPATCAATLAEIALWNHTGQTE